MSDEDDPHYPEFQRLLARLLAESRAPESETGEQRAERTARYYEIQRQLHELYRPVVGVDYDPPSTLKGANHFITPDELHPAREWIRDTSTARIMPDGFLQTERAASVSDGEAIKRAAESIRDTSPGAKLLAGQLTAHHILCGLSLRDEVLRALGMALGQGRRWEEHLRRRAVLAGDAAGKSTLQIATELGGIDTSMVRRLRRRKVPADVDDDPPRDARKLWDQVADLSEQGLVLPPHLFQAIIVALGLTNDRGRLRQQVIEGVLPRPQDAWVTIGLDRVEPEDVDDDDDGMRIIAELRRTEPRIGLRAPNLIVKALEVEARERVARGHWSEPALTYQQIADEVRVDFNTIRTWAAKDAWDRAVMSRAYWLGEPIRVALEHEAIAIVRNQTHPGDKALASLVNDTLAARSTRTWTTVTPGMIATWRRRLDWQERVDAKVKILAEAAKASREHGEAILARQAKRTRGRESG